MAVLTKRSFGRLLLADETAYRERMDDEEEENVGLQHQRGLHHQVIVVLHFWREVIVAFDA